MLSKEISLIFSSAYGNKKYKIKVIEVTGMATRANLSSALYFSALKYGDANASAAINPVKKLAKNLIAKEKEIFTRAGLMELFPQTTDKNKDWQTKRAGTQDNNYRKRNKSLG